MKKIFFEDISKYTYFMSEKAIKTYNTNKIIFGLIPLLALVPMFLWNDFSYAFMIFIFVIIGFKFPYVYLKLRHNQMCNDVIVAVPLWLNTIYALIEKNTIHNAIVNSMDENTPSSITSDLKDFIDKINTNPESKDAYIHFLSRYKIQGFSEIMLKLFEFRELDKNRLKDEFGTLNDSLEKINELKRENRFKSEVSLLDYIVAGVLIGAPCIYLLAVSMMPELYTSFM